MREELLESRVVAHLLIATCQTYEHFRTLGRVIVFAALYRAGVLLYFYETIVKTWAERPQTLTTHADSALFVAAILVLAAWAVERRSQRAIAWAFGASVPICLAIFYNNRRLACLSLLVGMAVAYLLLPPSRAKRQLNRLMLVSAPLFVVYCWLGWAKTSGIFKPVASIATMLGKTEDASSLTRDIENFNLLQTLKSSPLLGLGVGHSTTRSTSPIRSRTSSPSTDSSRTTACSGCSRSAGSSGSPGSGRSSSSPRSFSPASTASRISRSRARRRSRRSSA